MTEKTAAAHSADESTNYLAYPTLMLLPQREDPAQLRIEELEEEVQRRREAESRLEVDYERKLAETMKEFSRIEQELAQSRAAEQTHLAEISRLQLELEQRQTAEQTHLAEIQRLQQEIRKLQGEKSPQQPPKGSRMKNLGKTHDERSLDGVTPRNKITEVCFLENLETAPRRAADLSEAGDRSVLCWTETVSSKAKGSLFSKRDRTGKSTVVRQYIAGEGRVIAGSSCMCMFAGYENLTEVKSTGFFDTSGVTNMSELFWHCKSLTALDLSGWDTSNVTNMSGMFDGCTALESLNLAGWDTSRVTDMSTMFYCCSALRDYDPKWVNATQADKIMMYFGTRWQ